MSTTTTENITCDVCGATAPIRSQGGYQPVSRPAGWEQFLGMDMCPACLGSLVQMGTVARLSKRQKCYLERAVITGRFGLEDTHGNLLVVRALPRTFMIPVSPEDEDPEPQGPPQAPGWAGAPPSPFQSAPPPSYSQPPVPPVDRDMAAPAGSAAGTACRRQPGRQAGIRSDGNYYRSVLERNWATIFDRLRIAKEYEKTVLRTSERPYTPDFRLPDLGLWAEVKGDPQKLEKDMDRLIQAAIDLPPAGTPNLFIAGKLPYPELPPGGPNLYWAMPGTNTGLAFIVGPGDRVTYDTQPMHFDDWLSPNKLGFMHPLVAEAYKEATYYSASSADR